MNNRFSFSFFHGKFDAFGSFYSNMDAPLHRKIAYQKKQKNTIFKKLEKDHKIDHFENLQKLVAVKG